MQKLINCLCIFVKKINLFVIKPIFTHLDELNPREFILIKRARVNNLKNLSVAIPRNRLIVVTGLSGSGKSSLAFDTLFAEGQRMYVESLSAYARQFLDRMEKPEVDYIRGISPAIAIEQKKATRNPRSTVGTTTEIYDYLKLLYARIGDIISPISGKIVTRDTVSNVVDFIFKWKEQKRFSILCPLVNKDRTLREELNVLLGKGYTRIQLNGEIHFIEDLLKNIEIAHDLEIFILIDRAQVKYHDEDLQYRIADSVQTAFFEGHGTCVVEDTEGRKHFFSDQLEADGMKFEEPSINFFSFNNPYGACKRCEGFGHILGIDPDLVIPDRNKSIYEGAIIPWKSETMKKWLAPLLVHAEAYQFPIHRRVSELTPEQYNLLWDGFEAFKGLHAFFKYLESKTHKIQYRVMLSRYRGRTVCPDCEGTRLRSDAAFVKVGGRSIIDLLLIPVGDVCTFFRELKLDENKIKIGKRILIEIKNRLNFLQQVGLGYLTLNRLSFTLSGGEFQRIKLATSLGSSLVGSMYILDEPSIGLHPRDTHQLIGVLKHLRQLGNTVIVVEHDEEIMRAADQIIDIGPGAGIHGGELIFQGTVTDTENDNSTYTTKYLNGTEQITIPKQKRIWKHALEIKGARENNLKNIDVKIPLGIMTVITGVSGSGKSTLVKNILYPALGKILDISTGLAGKYDTLSGDYEKIRQVEYVDQNPIGKSSRSNPVTYVKGFDAIRQLYASQSLSKSRSYKPAYFSFNVDGGRCDVCQGEGTVKIEMQFMADIYLTCESCHGKRFKNEILEVKYHDKDISDILDMTVEEAIDFFRDHKSIINRLLPLKNVGLDYIRLGQSSNTLSGGEAQRVKLAYFLGKGKKEGAGNTLFIFDEPTTGLHFHDIKTLLKALFALIDQGNSILIIEHNMEIIKSADWVIDLGPEGGEPGGTIVFEGTPENLAKHTESYTGRFLALKMPSNTIEKE